MKPAHHHKGFTLIELMITVVIIAVLASIAYPSYTRYIRDARRTDAQIGLTRLAALLEKHYTQCNKYTTNFAGGINACTGVGSSTTSPEGYYNLTITTTDSSLSDYQITAAPVSTSTQANDGFFRLTSTGAKCWDKNNNNACDTTESSWKKH